MINSKKRRHSGRKIIDIEFEGGIDYRETYDEWNNHRDSFRDIGTDRTHKQSKIFPRGHWLYERLSMINKKIKKLNTRRRIKHEKQKLYI